MNIQWIAGFVDGEGSFGIAYTGRGFAPSLQVVQKIRHPLDDIQLYFSRGSVIPNRNLESFTWAIHSAEDLQYIIQSLLPELRVKYDEARLILSYVTSRLANRAMSNRTAPLPQSDLQLIYDFLTLPSVANRHKNTHANQTLVAVTSMLDST